MYVAETRSIRVAVEPAFLDERSDPEDQRYFWAYHIRIENHGAETVQLSHRRWRITDGDGRVEEVAGVGVVGETPTLRPGETFEYTSGAPLRTPSGIMVGSYRMQTEDGEQFDVAIPAFSLDSPYQAVKLN